MFTFLRRSAAFVGSLLLLAALANTASALAPPPFDYTNPYLAPPGGAYGIANVLGGAADLVQAQGDLLVQQQQARILAETANQAQLNTRKQTVDEMNYERANTPTFNDELEWNQAQLVRRMLNDPQPAEVTSGAAQNTLLPFLNDLISRGIPVPPVYLDPGVLPQLNIAVAGGGNLGLLKDHGKVSWPLALQGPAQVRLDSLLPQAVSATIQGNLTLPQYQEIRAAVAQLQLDLKTRQDNHEVESGSYQIARQFLDNLDSATAALQQPSAGKILDGTYAARGWTVAEMVQDMASHGLQFAPALPGEEAAYSAVQSAMVSYAGDIIRCESVGPQAVPPPGLGAYLR